MLGIVVAALILLSAAGLGRRALRVLRVHCETNLQTAGLALAVGLLCLTGLTILLGFADLWKPVYLWSLIAPGLLLAMTPLFKHLGRSPALLAAALRPHRLYLLILCAEVLPGLVIALAPPTDWDALVYHLTLPKTFLAEGGLVRMGYHAAAYYPINVETLYLLAMGIGGESAAMTLAWAGAGLAAWGILMLADRFSSRRIGWLAVILCFAAPTLHIGEYAHPEPYIAFYMCAWLLSLDTWLRQPTRASAALTAIFAAGVIGSRFTGLMVVPLSLFLTAADWYSRRNQRPAGNRRSYATPAQGALALLAATLLGSVWYIRNIWLVGNPFYPGFTSIFGGTPPLATRQVLGMIAEVHTLSAWLLYPLYLGMGPGRPVPPGAFYHPALGPWFLALIPAAMFLGPVDRRLRGYLWGLLAFSYVAYWAISDPRYVMPYAVPLILLCATGFERLASSHRAYRVLLWALLCLSALPFVTLHAAKSASRLDLVLGLRERESFLESADPLFAAALYANRTLVPTDRLLLIARRPYYFDVPYVFADPLLQANIDFETIQHRDEFDAVVRTNHITHICIEKAPLTTRAPWVPRLLDEYAPGRLELLFQKGTVELFRVLPPHTMPSGGE